ncbi:MAG: DHHW family protein [Lachnospirales bacterium]
MKITSVLITALVIFAIIGFLIMPKNNFSENENRNLQKFPKFNIENIVEGKFTSDLNKYLQDHFPLRNSFIKIKTVFEKDILREKLINNIYVCNDDYLIEKYEKPKNMDKIIDTFNEFDKNTNIKPDLMLVPTAFTVLEDKLPYFAPKGEQLKDLEKYYSLVTLNTIDTYTPLYENKDNYIFYRLDHHWTSNGAYIGYVAYCNKKGIKPVDKSEFSIEKVSEDFKGTIYSKLNDNKIEADTILSYNKNYNITVKYDKETTNSLYAPKYLEGKDKYSYFLNNINSFIEITNNDINTNDELVIAKDSYANSMIPFLVNHYKKIYVFDPRSYKGSISEFANSNGNIKDILILYNMNTIDNDTGVNMIY